MIPLHSMPLLIACCNGLAGVLLILGFFLIRARKIPQHRACMISAFACSCLFLLLYLWFHYRAGVIRFGGQGWIRPLYFALLISHTTLAIVIVPLVLITLSRGLGRRFAAHRAIARWAFPLWLYVSVTGVIVYWLLYVAYTPIWPT
jgi:putative membrane protein